MSFATLISGKRRSEIGTLQTISSAYLTATLCMKRTFCDIHVFTFTNQLAVNSVCCFFEPQWMDKTMNKKDAYVEKAQAKIEEQIAKLDQFKAQVKGKVADKKIDAHERIERLETELNAAKARLAEIADSAEDAWEGLTDRFESLADEVSASVKNFLGK